MSIPPSPRESSQYDSGEEDDMSIPSSHRESSQHDSGEEDERPVRTDAENATRELAIYCSDTKVCDITVLNALLDRGADPRCIRIFVVAVQL